MSSTVPNSTALDRKSSPLLALPVEVRLKIYALLFHCAEALVIEPAEPAYQEDFDHSSYSPASVIDHANDKDKDPFPSPALRIQPLHFYRPAYLSYAPSSTTWGVGMSSQLLLTCRQIHHEAIPILYGTNRFDCSMRSAPTILAQIISVQNFALIRHLILDWDQLQDFAWSLAKDEQVHATRGLEILELNRFRTRIFPRTRSASAAESETTLGIAPDPSATLYSATGSWSRWHHADVVNHERQLFASALAIVEKHAQLRHVLQTTMYKSQPRGYLREPSTQRDLVDMEAAELARRTSISRPIPEMKVTARIRWRFVTERGVGHVRKLKEGEIDEVLDLVRDLAALEEESRL